MACTDIIQILIQAQASPLAHGHTQVPVDPPQDTLHVLFVETVAGADEYLQKASSYASDYWRAGCRFAIDYLANVVDYSAKVVLESYGDKNWLDQ